VGKRNGGTEKARLRGVSTDGAACSGAAERAFVEAWIVGWLRKAR
jgi:hypothetical protein